MSFTRQPAEPGGARRPALKSPRAVRTQRRSRDAAHPGRRKGCGDVSPGEAGAPGSPSWPLGILGAGPSGAVEREVGLVAAGRGSGGGGAVCRGLAETPGFCASAFSPVSGDAGGSPSGAGVRINRRLLCRGLRMAPSAK